MRLLFGPTDVPVAGTRVQLNNSRDKVRKIWFGAQWANVGAVYVGDVSVSATASGIELHSRMTKELDFGEGSVEMNTFYVNTAEAGNDLDWVAIVD